MTKITPDEFKMFSRYIHKISGIFLEQSKSYLIETRLGNLVKECGCSSYVELYKLNCIKRLHPLPAKI